MSAEHFFKFEGLENLTPYLIESSIEKKPEDFIYLANAFHDRINLREIWDLENDIPIKHGLYLTNFLLCENFTFKDDDFKRVIDQHDFQLFLIYDHSLKNFHLQEMIDYAEEKRFDGVVSYLKMKNRREYYRPITILEPLLVEKDIPILKTSILSFLSSVMYSYYQTMFHSFREYFIEFFGDIFIKLCEYQLFDKFQFLINWSKELGIELSYKLILNISQQNFLDYYLESFRITSDQLIGLFKDHQKLISYGYYVFIKYLVDRGFRFNEEDYIFLIEKGSYQLMNLFYRQFPVEKKHLEEAARKRALFIVYELGREFPEEFEKCTGIPELILGTESSIDIGDGEILKLAKKDGNSDKITTYELELIRQGDDVCRHLLGVGSDSGNFISYRYSMSIFKGDEIMAFTGLYPREDKKEVYVDYFCSKYPGYGKKLFSYIEKFAIKSLKIRRLRLTSLNLASDHFYQKMGMKKIEVENEDFFIKDI